MERRKEPRLPFRVEAEVKFASGEVFRLIYTLNISRGGMTVDLPKAPHEGMEVTIILVPPKGATLELQGLVRHVSAMKKTGTGHCQVGVQFTNLDDAKRAFLEGLIRSNTFGNGTIGIAPKKT